jgi:murein DD-endopeptidase MepM/ murein hydrolase activator NlpD
MALGSACPGLAQTGQTSEATIETERLLGSGEQDAQAQALLPFTRSLSASGAVTASLAEATAAAGVPASAMLGALRALEGATDPREPQDGDAFYVRWEQTYTAAGDPIGVGRVLWMELRTPAGATIAIHRFRPREGAQQFFLTSGLAATPPAIALPIDDVTVSSRFGIRPDPLGRSATRSAAVAATGAMGGPLTGRRAAPQAAKHMPPRPFAGFAPRIFMHEGIDLAVPQGTPIYAASDGVVSGARPNGGYGNWIRIDHTDGLATAYGHLSRFAPGIKPGVPVVQGELVGFSGNTGRSTGPHLHFEVLTDGKPVDPLAHAAVAQLAGADLERFARQVAAEQRDRESEEAVTPAAEF